MFIATKIARIIKYSNNLNYTNQNIRSQAFDL